VCALAGVDRDWLADRLERARRPAGGRRPHRVMTRKRKAPDVARSATA
jgi:hypothetical protein